MCNKVWSKKRLLDAGIIAEEEAMCERCGEEVETDFHRYFACKANGCIEHEDVTDTNWLANTATNNPTFDPTLEPSLVSHLNGLALPF